MCLLPDGSGISRYLDFLIIYPFILYATQIIGDNGNKKVSFITFIKDKAEFLVAARKYLWQNSVYVVFLKSFSISLSKDFLLSDIHQNV